MKMQVKALVHQQLCQNQKHQLLILVKFMVLLSTLQVILFKITLSGIFRYYCQYIAFKNGSQIHLCIPILQNHTIIKVALLISPDNSWARILLGILFRQRNPFETDEPHLSPAVLILYQLPYGQKEKISLMSPAFKKCVHQVGSPVRFSVLPCQ